MPTCTTKTAVSILGIPSQTLRQYVRALEATGYTFFRVTKRGDLYYTDADIDLLRSVYELSKESHLSVLEAAFASQQKPIPTELQPTYISNAKPRDSRKRSHNEEWLEDLLVVLKSEKGILQGSLVGIAMRVGCAVSTLREVLKLGEEKGLFVVKATRGRHGYTTITHVKNNEKSEFNNLPFL